MEKGKNIKHVLDNSSNSKVLDSLIPLPYTVPTNYFNVVPEIIVKKATADTLKISKKLGMEYSLPFGYFDEFSKQMTSKLSELKMEDELSSVAPTLSTIPRNVQYHVPANYFEKNILHSETKSTQKARIISLKIVKQFLAAAVLIGVIAMGVIGLIKNNTSISTVNQPQELIAKPTINMLTDDELTKYINNDYLAYSSESVIIDDATVPDIKQNVEVVSDEDLDTYLQDAATSTTVKKGI
jgi:hypothetical protein